MTSVFGSGAKYGFGAKFGSGAKARSGFGRGARAAAAGTAQARQGVATRVIQRASPSDFSSPGRM